VDLSLQHKNFGKSEAEQKRVWKGGNGAFKKEEITSWFRLYNITGIGKVAGYFKKSHKEYSRAA
jgi:hypothetical protein